MFQRFRAAVAAGRHAAATPAEVGQQLPDSAGVLVTWALIHFGDAGAIGPRLAEHRAFCLKQGIRCLFVSDDIPLLCVRSRDVQFEFVPWPARTALTTPGQWAGAVDHSFLRLGQIMRFWQVVGCNWEGERARDLFGLAPDWAHPALRAGGAGKGTASQ